MKPASTEHSINKAILNTTKHTELLWKMDRHLEHALRKKLFNDAEQWTLQANVQFFVVILK